MSSPNSILTPSSQSVSCATTTALPRSTKNQSRYTETRQKSSKATAYQTVSGAYPSIPNNHKRTPCSPNKHKETSFNGSMPPPSVQVSAHSSRPPNEIFSSPGHSYTQSHSPVLATFHSHCQKPSQPTTTTSSPTIHRRDTTGKSHPHTIPHHLRSDSRSQTTNRQLLQ